MRAHPDQMCPAGAMLDRDQRVNPSEQHGVDVQEVYGQNSLGLGGEKLSPSGTRPARRGIEACVMQDLPHGRSRDAVAEPDSWPCTRRCPQLGFSVAIRMTNFLIAAAVGGRPGCRRAV